MIFVFTRKNPTTNEVFRGSICHPGLLCYASATEEATAGDLLEAFCNFCHSDADQVPPSLVVDRANAPSTGGAVKNRRNVSSTRRGGQQQGLVFDAKRENMTKMVPSTGGCQRQAGEVCEWLYILKYDSEKLRLKKKQKNSTGNITFLIHQN